MLKINRLSMMTISIALFILFFQLFNGIASFEVNSEVERMASVESAISRAAVQCYAIEGSYPPTLEYLVENYGIRLNETQFIYHYEVVAANIHPQIAVYKKW